MTGPGLGGIPIEPGHGCGCIRCCAERRAADLKDGGEAARHAMGMLLPRGFRYACEVCGCKRCPHHRDHRFRCTGSNEPNQVGEPL